MNIYGASGHAKVIFDIIRSRNIEVHHVFDDDFSIVDFCGLKVTHAPTKEMVQKFPNLIAIGNNRTRKKVASGIIGVINPYVSHPSAVVSPNTLIGDGTVVMANASVNSEANIGKHCIVNTGAVVEHEVELGDFVHISPNASIAGNVTIGEGTQIGIGACVIQGLHIGKWAVIGAGAVIIENIPDYAVVVGNPGRIVKLLDSLEE